MSDSYTTTPPLRVDLTLPSMRLALGPVVYDPLKELLGFDPREALTPLLRSAPYVRTAGGAAVEVFPLAIAPGVHVATPLGPLGEFAVANDQGLLALTLPARAAGLLPSQAGGLVVAGPQAVVDRDGLHRVSVVWLRLRPGLRTAIPLGLLGELGLEAA